MNSKYAFILGCTSDIAIAFSKRLAKEKYNLILAGRNKTEIDAIAKDLQIRYEIATEMIEIDLEKIDSKHIPSILKNLTHPFEIFANFVGYLGNQKTAETNFMEIEKIININFTKVVLLTEVIVNQMLKWKKKDIIQNPIIVGVSSVAGDRGRQSNYFYGSAKAGYSAYLSGLRNRLFIEGFSVLTIKPGFVHTKMTRGMNLPKLLTAQPEEVANDIYNAIKKRKNILYTKWFWKYIMLIIKMIPESIFKRLKL